ncbi:MAG: PIN domain nuclease, partial [Thermoprotei archaeon]
KEAEDRLLRVRSISIIDSTIIAVALRLKTPIVSGDLDLTYVARNMGIEIIW